MSADESGINYAIGIFDPKNQPILIARNVEYGAPVFRMLVVLKPCLTSDRAVQAAANTW